MRASRTAVGPYALPVALLLCACGAAARPPMATATAEPTEAPARATSASASATQAPAATATPGARATTTPTPGPAPRIFIASEYTHTVQVWQGEPPLLVTAIRVGNTPHNISASNSGRWVATSNRLSGQVSIIDSATLVEEKRVYTGSRPHDLSWAPDDRWLYVTHEDETYIAVIDTSTWRVVKLIEVATPQHDLSMSPDGSQIWVTSFGARSIIIVDRQAGAVKERIARFEHGAHDITFVPERGEVWVTSSGFIAHASQVDPFVLIFDYDSLALVDSQPIGIYPFHSAKRYRDGPFRPASSDQLWYSDRGLGGLLLVDTAAREVVATVKTGRSPFHLSFGPGGLLYTANHDDSTMSVIDPDARTVVHTIQVAGGPHGIVVVAAPESD